MNKGRRLSAGRSLMLLLSCLIASIIAIKYWLPSSTSQLEYGIFLVFLSSLLFTTGLRAYTAEKRNDLTRSLLLGLAPAWFSLGASYLLQAIDSVPIPFGKISFLTVYICIIVISSAHSILSIASQVNQVALLSVVLCITNVLEIVNLYGDSDHTFSVASLSMLYAILSFYILISDAVCYYKESVQNGGTTRARERREVPKSNALMNAVSGSHLLTLISILILSIDSNNGNTCEVGIHLTCGGVFQIVIGISLLRYQDSFRSFISALYGITWSALGFTLLTKCWMDDEASAISSRDAPSTIPVIIGSVLLFFLSAKYTIYDMVFNFLFVLELIALLTTGYHGTFFAVVTWLLSLLVTYHLFSSGFAMVSNSITFPLGQYDQIVQEMLSCVKRLYCCYTKGPMHPIESLQKKINSLTKENELIGYTKYANVEMLGFLANCFASAAYLFLQNNIFGIAWVVIPGSFIQFIVGSICYARGKSFESCVFLLYSTFWLVSGTSRGLLDVLTETHISLAFGPIGFLVVGIVLVGISFTISKAWTTFLILMLLNPVMVILDLSSDKLSNQVEVPLVVLFCLSGLYCFVSMASKVWWGVSLLPEGKAFVNIIYGNEGTKKVIMASSRQTSGVRQIADILNNGGIVGIPTDTVYILCAACKHPQAVERAYNTKKQAGDRPMSMWISNLNQLECARKELGPLLWSFMKKVWPSSISCVIPKGDWLEKLGMSESAKYIGRPDSIAVRLPDYTITTHLIDLVGPIAVTSANPSGEADTTHHAQVLARLGTQNCDGILCDGPSPENAASTVVDCRKIDEHRLGFFRIGITPKSSVEELFQEVLKEVQSNQEGAFHRVLNGSVYQQSVHTVSPESPNVYGTSPISPVSALATYNTYENTKTDLANNISLIQIHGNDAEFPNSTTSSNSVDSSGIGSSESGAHDNDGYISDSEAEKDTVTKRL